MEIPIVYRKKIWDVLDNQILSEKNYAKVEMVTKQDVSFMGYS